MSERRHRSALDRTVTCAALSAVAGLLALTAPPATAVGAGNGPAPTALRLTTAANSHPELISGPSTLIRVSLPAHADPHRARITENGRDISDAFAEQPDGTLLGLATGLRVGGNELTAAAGKDRATLRITDHPSTGPVFSGPQQHPYFCETTAFGLSAARQPDCSAPTKVTYWYRTRDGAFKTLTDPRSRPADLATAHVDGRAVPYVVRMETGTIDRAVYQTAVLYDGRAPSPLRTGAGWNHKLVYTFGGGCNGGYHQGDVTGGVLDDLMLSQGYGVASSSLNVLDQNCSTVLSAEAAMMVKEHFADVNGPIRYTIGWGASGGAIQQYDIADAYPGILDGIVAGVPFPDPLSTAVTTEDCLLLDNWFAAGGRGLSAAQRQAVAGFRSYDTCTSWIASFADRITPTGSCNRQLVSPDAAIPTAALWDPARNPHGVQCSLQRQLGNQLGVDPRTGLAPLPYDNTGVQYGLSALDDDAISPDQFVALNRAVGGLDQYGAPVAARSSASARMLTTAYREDLILSGGQGLRSTPVIDQRTDMDEAGVLSDIHTTQWSFALRARLLRANGTAANQVVIENQATPEQTVAASAYELSAMDRWLANISEDTTHRDPRDKVVAGRPAGLGDGCYLPSGQRVLAPLTYPATGPCAALYPVASSPRGVAGAPLAADVLKCQLRPIDFSSYRVRFTAAQRRALRAAFPEGVCAYDRPAVGSTPPMGTWLSYGDGSCGTFGRAPAPRPVGAASACAHEPGGRPAGHQGRGVGAGAGAGPS
ncbi:DUF6351 family protein [Actinacidiphila guanduensis]|uniref:DUF6351 domain-containing protein n=1 Tax=Actinacidiphila guanduensis TaxID=310781 RepID=A0A1H0HDY4_9ACTN|nr:DUF6351 family protein [Actinacidiphila guanduensis]SDO17385.1 hypothetical protein SAMN05216259_10819 [Actinacidiphila guanduensis]